LRPGPASMDGLGWPCRLRERVVGEGAELGLRGDAGTLRVAARGRPPASGSGVEGA
jgi:hypothetical protein